MFKVLFTFLLLFKKNFIDCTCRIIITSHFENLFPINVLTRLTYLFYHVDCFEQNLINFNASLSSDFELI